MTPANQIVTASDAATVITSILGFVKDNIAFILPLVAFGVGYAIYRKSGNRALKGKL